MFETQGSDSNTALYLESGEAAKNMGDKTSATISRDVSNLTKDQKGKVSSAFAYCY